MSNRTTQTNIALYLNNDKKRKPDRSHVTEEEPALKKPKTESVAKTTVVKLKRKNGQIVQDCDVYIGRAINMGGWRLKASKWANPFKVKDLKTNENAVEKYREYLMKNDKLLKDLPELKGKILGCWCKPARCHGDVLVELVNKLDDNSENDEKLQEL